MSKHTPGPWAIGEFPFDIFAKEKHVAEVCYDKQGLRRHHEEHTANANLIAAAPELFSLAKEALVSLNAANEVMGGGQYCDGGEYSRQKTEEYYVEIRKKLMAIINKVEGKT